MKFLSKISFFLLLISIIPLNAQNYETRQKNLEAQKISLKKEINQINSLIAESKKKSKNLSNDLEDLQLKITLVTNELNKQKKVIEENQVSIEAVDSYRRQNNQKVADILNRLNGLKCQNTNFEDFPLYFLEFPLYNVSGKCYVDISPIDKICMLLCCTIVKDT